MQDENENAGLAAEISTDAAEISTTAAQSSAGDGSDAGDGGDGSGAAQADGTGSAAAVTTAPAPESAPVAQDPAAAPAPPAPAMATASMSGVQDLGQRVITEAVSNHPELMVSYNRILSKAAGISREMLHDVPSILADIKSELEEFGRKVAAKL